MKSSTEKVKCAVQTSEIFSMKKLWNFQGQIWKGSSSTRKWAVWFSESFLANLSKIFSKICSAAVYKNRYDTKCTNHIFQSADVKNG